MRVGSLVYATRQGLGILAKSFYDAGVVTDVIVVRHHHRHTHDDWFPRAMQTPIRPMDTELVRAFCRSMDVMLFLETPFDWTLVPFCQDHGVKVVLMPMHECMPRRLPYQPDAFLNPSHLDQQCYPQGVHIPVPYDGVHQWKRRERARTFLHSAGWGGLNNRNGTGELLDAMKLVKNPIKLIIQSQKKLPWDGKRSNVEVRIGDMDREKLYDDGDVFAFPEKFNGLSLPLQEARAAGMLVMCGDRFPVNEWLPREPLILVNKYRWTHVAGSCRDFEEAIMSPLSIARKMDEWYDKDIGAYSDAGRQWAEDNSWAKLRPRYQQFLQEVRDGRRYC